MTYLEAQNSARALLTAANAAEWAMLETDHSLWVESNIMAPAGIDASICTNFGERVADWIEGELEKIHIAYIADPDRDEAGNWIGNVANENGWTA